MKRVLVITLGIFISSCSPSSDMNKGVEAAINNTPITIVIQIDEVSMSTDLKAHESKSTVSATVISTIRGHVSDKIQYTVISEIGDKPEKN